MSAYCDMTGTTARWAVPDGPLAVALPDGIDGDVAATCGDATATATNDGQGLAWLTGSEAEELMPAIGVHAITWSQDGSTLGETPVERVGNRYCTRGDVIIYGERNGDAFERLPDEAFATAVSSAEEAIEDACGRSFTERAATVRLLGGYVLEELPVVDARTISDGVLLGDRQCRVKEPGEYRVTYGSRTDARVRSAATQLAAFYLRRRVVAENARGQSTDGVYVSYTLATGEEGSWTGLPYVDAFIEARRCRRVFVK